MRKWIALAAYLWSVVTAISGVVSLFRGDVGGGLGTLLFAAILFLIGFFVWRSAPHQLWRIPKAALTDLRRRLGQQFRFLEKLFVEGLISDRVFQDSDGDVDTLVANLVLELNMLSMRLAQANRWNDAEETALLALRLDPDAVAAKMALAYVLSATGRREQAVPYARDALREIGPDDDPYNVRELLETIARGEANQ